MIEQQLVNGLAIGCIYVLIALGITMIYGILRLIHIAHGVVFTAGAYTAFLSFFITDNVLFAMAIAAAVTSLLGALIYLGVYRRLLQQPRTVAVIASVGIFTFMGDLYRFLGGPYNRTLPLDIGIGNIEIGDIILVGSQSLIMIVVAVLLVILWIIMSKTRFGLALKAAALDHEAASIVGINTGRIVTLTFMLGSAMAGIAGVLVGVQFNSIYPLMGNAPTFKALAVIILGGFGSIKGCIIGGLFLGLIETIMIGYFPSLLPRDSIAFVSMIIMLIIRPYGLFGKE